MIFAKFFIFFWTSISNLRSLSGTLRATSLAADAANMAHDGRRISFVEVPHAPALPAAEVAARLDASPHSSPTCTRIPRASIAAQSHAHSGTRVRRAVRGACGRCVQLFILTRSHNRHPPSSKSN